MRREPCGAPQLPLETDLVVDCRRGLVGHVIDVASCVRDESPCETYAREYSERNRWRCSVPADRDRQQENARRAGRRESPEQTTGFASAARANGGRYGREHTIFSSIQAQPPGEIVDLLYLSQGSSLIPRFRQRQKVYGKRGCDVWAADSGVHCRTTRADGERRRSEESKNRRRIEGDVAEDAR